MSGKLDTDRLVPEVKRSEFDLLLLNLGPDIVKQTQHALETACGDRERVTTVLKSITTVVGEALKKMSSDKVTSISNHDFTRDASLTPEEVGLAIQFYIHMAISELKSESKSDVSWAIHRPPESYKENRRRAIDKHESPFNLGEIVNTVKYIGNDLLKKTHDFTQDSFEQGTTEARMTTIENLILALTLGPDEKAAGSHVDLETEVEMWQDDPNDRTKQVWTKQRVAATSDTPPEKVKRVWRVGNQPRYEYMQKELAKPKYQTILEENMKIKQFFFGLSR
ncbi:MAG: hypothetical protein HZA34_03565 [Candidatus Pacebacteria bacterium]|nr:hypothetical protein [Candidatus Paceibacterota bacterium]